MLNHAQALHTACQMARILCAENDIDILRAIRAALSSPGIVRPEVFPQIHAIATAAVDDLYVS